VPEEIARQVALVLAVLFAVGAVVIGIGTLLRRAPARIWTIYFSEIVVIALLLGPAYFGRWPMMAMSLLLSLVCTRELVPVLGQAGLAPSPGGSYATGVAIILAAGLGRAAVLPAALAVSLVASIVLALISGGTERLARRAGGGLVVLVFPVLGAAYLTVLSRRADGFGHLVWLYGVVETGDAGALLFGSIFGVRKIWPRLSPKKTVVGSVAGLACSVIAGVGLRFAIPGSSALRCLAMGLGFGVAGQIADLTASAIKRDAGVKDFAATVPAQGGVLDVYDSVLLVAPVYGLLLSILEAC
jgi:phosphatidate cytidylyltransferase